MASLNDICGFLPGCAPGDLMVLTGCLMSKDA